jgi:hypothetical protein
VSEREKCRQRQEAEEGGRGGGATAGMDSWKFVPWQNKPASCMAQTGGCRVLSRFRTSSTHPVVCPPHPSAMVCLPAPWCATPCIIRAPVRKEVKRKKEG